MKNGLNMKKAIFLICFLATVSFTQAQNIRYVKPVAIGTGDGSSWENASSNIQAMINASASGNQVWIAAGTYPLTATLQMKEGVNVYGGFYGNENNVNDRAKSDLDGNGTIEPWEFTHASVLDGQNARQVLNQPDDFTIETIYDGLTFIKGGNTSVGAGASIRAKSQLLNCIVSGNTSTQIGGGISSMGGLIGDCIISKNTVASNSNIAAAGGIYNSSGIVSNCTVIGNSVSSTYYSSLENSVYISGGGIYNSRGIIKNCTVSKNTISSSTNNQQCDGGGIRNVTGGTITNCIVSENKVSSSATFGVYVSGGGISNQGSGTIAECVISNNTVTVTSISFNDRYARGGGIYNIDGTINNCVINKNTAEIPSYYGSYAYGGGIFNYGTITNCVISENMASAYALTFGGGIYCYDVINSIVKDCVVENNKTHWENVILIGNGGGIYQGNITRCIIKGNGSDVGGGLCSSTATNCLLLENNASSFGGGGNGTTTINCTFVGNTATTEGGGIYGNDTYPSSATNCIFWQNDAPVGAQVYNDASVTYSAIQDGFTGTGNINITQDNEIGGPRFVNPTADNYQLQANSPCINKGSNAAVTADITVDLLGNPRISGGTVDMGAYEWHESSGILNISADNSFIVIYPNPASIELYVKLALHSQETASYIILNSMGQNVMQGQLYDSPINIQSLANGIYYLKITGIENVTVKFIKN